MTTTVAPTTAERLERIWSDAPGLVGFFSTVDHKRIGIRYLVTSLVFLVFGGIEALLLRTQLIGAGREILSPEVFNELMSIHGTTMLLFFNTPVWAGFGNYFLPIQIGTRDMAFPRMNMLSYWVFLLAGIFTYSSFLIGEIPIGGWFAYPPFTSALFLPGTSIDFYTIGISFLGVSTTLGGINFLVTTFKMRAPGMTASRIPIFVWGILITSFIIIFALPAITLANVLLEIDRALGFNFFNPSAGGDPVLYQHLFWLWGHPEVYIVFVPATAVVSMVVQTFSRVRLVAYLWVVTALAALAFISFGVWVHHMFTVGLGFAALSFFSAASMMVSIPSGIQFFAWIATMWKGRPRFPTPMLYAVGMMLIFLLGGITGVMVAMVPADFVYQDSYFVVAHFHYVLVGGSVFPIFAALYYWMPKWTGRMYSELVGKLSFWTMFIAFNVAFFPMHILGLMGMPRRVYTYEAGLGWDGLNLIASIGAYVFAFGIALSFGNWLWSIYSRRGAEAGPNPWEADTLEWATSSPPPHYNFLEFPKVQSLTPLWDEKHEEGVVEEPGHDRPVLLPPEGEFEHYTLATGGVEAETETIMPMPPPSFYPFLVALGMFIASYGALIRQFWLGVAGVFVITASLMGWFWPEAEREHEIEVVA